MSDILPVHSRRRSYHLWLGMLLVLFVASIAIWGPQWAPQDPMQPHEIVKINGEWVSAPFPPFHYALFPLGTDQNGRDILSQVLWAVRPTMIMVTIVAVVRMVLGLAIGLAAGWLVGRPGRLLNHLIATAVSSPVLIVALAVIAAVGIDLGVMAFILGLAITGWAETARLVSERTRSLRRMPFIEAARSLGQTDVGLLFHHILRQIAPMVWMLFAFEISSTLVASASLGFLGYYIGGEVWTAVTDTSSVRSAGMPELGQMVATLSTDIFTGPYKMAAAGTIIFLTILGFNLLGEGLRLRLESGSPRSSRWALWSEQVGLWADHAIWHPFTQALRRSRALSFSLGMALLAGMVAGAWLLLRPAPPAVIPASLSVPGGHLWASQLHDAHGTGQTKELGPHLDLAVLWTVHESGGFSGGPAIDAAGNLYIASTAKRLIAYDRDGQMRWSQDLFAEPVGSPAIGEEGRVYIVDELGGLTALSPSGQSLWRLPPEGSAPSTSGPVVDREGNIYYMRAGQVQAVSPQGTSLWLSQARTTRTVLPPAISPDGKLLFALEAVLRTADGEKLSFDKLFDADQFIVGADGRYYARSGFLLAEWRQVGDGAEIVQRIDWKYQLYGLISPPTQTGATAGSAIWKLFVSGFEDGHFIWLDQSGKVTGDARFPHREAGMVGVDGSGLAYICGTNRITQVAECLALKNGQDEPLWTFPLPYGANSIAGGALGTGTLYVATLDGYLIAIGSQP